MKNLWDERYGSKDYVYGTKPNEYLKKQIENLPAGKILFPAEGEGRNAIFAAQKGWDVTAYDASIEGIKKCEILAKKYDVNINYKNESHESFNSDDETFDCIVLIYSHFAPGKRQIFHNKLMKYLKPGGSLILEGFSKQQINNTSGGPQNIDMLFSETEIIDDFKGFYEINISEETVDLDEGSFHQGKASVIRVTGKK